jgi:hypothetical protein
VYEKVLDPNRISTGTYAVQTPASVPVVPSVAPGH